MKVNIYGHYKQWLMIDCGLTFNVPLDREKDNTIGIMRYNTVTVDISVIANRRDSLCGIVISLVSSQRLFRRRGSSSLDSDYPLISSCSRQTASFALK